MIQNNITFNSVKNEGLRVESAPLYKDFIGVNEYGGIINAVDIDWNEAELKKLNSAGTGTTNISVTTTGELLSIIKALVEQCANLKSTVNAQTATIETQSSQIEQLQSAVVSISNAVVQSMD